MNRSRRAPQAATPNPAAAEATPPAGAGPAPMQDNSLAIAALRGLSTADGLAALGPHDRTAEIMGAGTHGTPRPAVNPALPGSGMVNDWLNDPQGAAAPIADVNGADRSAPATDPGLAAQQTVVHAPTVTIPGS